MMSADSSIQASILFNFIVHESVIVEKLMGRRVCPQCGMNYNVCKVDRDGYHWRALLPTKSEKHCDKCSGVELVCRDDDKPDIIKSRLQTYREQTEPILDYYRQRPETKVIDFEAFNGVDDLPKMIELLDMHLQGRQKL